MELHLELLLGKKVHDANGRLVGRIEEFIVEEGPGGAHLVEFHLGRAALLERLGGAMLKLPFLSQLRSHEEPVRIPWDKLDLSDPESPRLLGDFSPVERKSGR